MRIAKYISLILLCLNFVSCDTEESLDKNYENFFLKYYGAEGNQMGIDLLEMPDGGFIILGSSTSTGGNTQIWLTRTDELGNEIWSNTYGGSKSEIPSDIEFDANGNIVVGATVEEETANSTDVLLYRVNIDGNKIDSALYGYPGTSERLNRITLVSNSDLIAVGSTENVDINKNGYNATTDLQDIYSLRVDNNLVEVQSFLWKNVIGFPGSDVGKKILERTDGSFIFFGVSDDPNSNTQNDGFNLILFPTNDLGDVGSQFEVQYFGTLGDEDASDIIQTFDGGFAMVGTTTQGGVRSIFTARVRNNINFVSASNLSLSEDMTGVSLAQSNNGGFFILGVSNANLNGDIELTKISESGTIDWIKSFGGVDNDSGSVIRQSQDGSLLILGTIELESQRKIVLIKTNRIGELKP